MYEVLHNGKQKHDFSGDEHTTYEGGDPLVGEPAGVAAQVLGGDLEHSEGVGATHGRDTELARWMQRPTIEQPQHLRSG